MINFLRVMLSNMEAVLYIGHGSRVKEANEQADFFVRKLMRKKCTHSGNGLFLSFPSQLIAQSFENCIQTGCYNDICSSYFAFNGTTCKKGYSSRTFPLKGAFPNVNVHYGHPIGVNEKMIGLCRKELKKPKYFQMKHCSVLLVGTGQ